MCEMIAHKIEYLTNGNGNRVANCAIVRIGSQLYFWSYDTCCACVESDGTIHRFTDRRTNTTSKQLNTFFYQYHIEGIDSKKFYQLPLEVLE